MTSTWEKDNKTEAQEWEHLAFEKCELNNEQLVAHYFEDHMCLRCFKVAPFSILRTKKQLKDGSWDFIESKWCTACGHYHGRQRRNSGRPVSRKGLRRRTYR